MSTLLKRNLLALMLACASVAIILPATSDIASFAKNGSDSDSSGSGSSGGSSGGGHSDSDSDSDSGSDSDSDSDSGSSSDSDGENSGSDDSNHSGSHHDSDDDSDDSDDSDDDGRKKEKDAKKADNKAGKSAARPTVTLSLNAQELSQVISGNSVVVDQLGRPLELSVRTVNGATVVSGKPHGGAAKRNPGPITSVSIVSAASVPGNDDGTPDQGKGDN